MDLINGEKLPEFTAMIWDEINGRWYYSFIFRYHFFMALSHRIMVSVPDQAYNEFKEMILGQLEYFRDGENRVTVKLHGMNHDYVDEQALDMHLLIRLWQELAERFVEEDTDLKPKALDLYQENIKRYGSRGLMSARGSTSSFAAGLVLLLIAGENMLIHVFSWVVLGRDSPAVLPVACLRDATRDY